MSATEKETTSQPDLNRRQFLRNLMGVGAAGVATVAVGGQVSGNFIPLETVETQTPPAVIPALDGPQDPLERMRVDLKRAMQKPVAERRWVMVIDLRKCIGCHACTVACIAENKLPPGVVYRPVLTEEIGTYPNVTMRFTPRPCMQCDNPPCVPVCPVNATYKDENGIVTIDYNQCIGCRYCITACPYGARVFDFGETYTQNTPSAEGLIAGREQTESYEKAANFEYGEAIARDTHSSPVGNVRKCHFCLHRLAEGMLPACTTTCIGRATYFGDANDPDSLVSELVASPNVMRLKEELGTAPRVYYLT